MKRISYFFLAGDVPQIQLREIEQVTHQPVADMICGAVAKLNKSGYPATLETLCMELSKHHSDLPPPSPDTVQKNLDALLNAEFIYRLGENLFLSKAPTVPYIFAKKANVKCNAECQTGKSIIYSPESQQQRQEFVSKHRRGNYFFQKRKRAEKWPPFPKTLVLFLSIKKLIIIFTDLFLFYFSTF